MKVEASNEQPAQEEFSNQSKVTKRLPYIGVWLKGVAGNNPVFCYHPDFAAQIEPFLESLGQNILKASIQMEEKPLITRLNLRGLSTNVMELLGKVAS